MQTERAATVAIEVAPEAGGEPVRRELATDSANDHVASVRIPGLLPGTAYRYRIAGQGDAREGVARTQRYWSTAAEAAELVIAIGSCHFIPNANPVFRGVGGGDYQIFDAIAARRPDLMLWLGDVELFLLDNRYYRHPNRYPDGPEKTMFGAAQLEWLKQALLASRARLKIVAGGSQFWNRASRFEALNTYPHEQKRLADWLLGQRIDGVVFLSGDRHFGELLRIERAGAYPLYEYTSSPLSSSPVTRIDAAERDNPDLVPGTLHGRRQFGLVRVSGPGGNRRVAFEAYDSDGALLWRHEVAASDLRFPRERQP